MKYADQNAKNDILLDIPNSHNKDTTKQICKECHESLRAIINQFMDSVTSYTSKTTSTYLVVYPNLSNKETTKYLAYDDHKNLEKEINKFIESGGIQE